MYSVQGIQRYRIKSPKERTHLRINFTRLNQGAKTADLLLLIIDPLILLFADPFQPRKVAQGRILSFEFGVCWEWSIV